MMMMMMLMLLLWWWCCLRVTAAHLGAGVAVALATVGVGRTRKAVVVHAVFVIVRAAIALHPRLLPPFSGLDHLTRASASLALLITYAAVDDVKMQSVVAQL